ncbi:MAG: flagellar export chaperone FliS [Oscillospiraceae bacterium]|nr:flagellar export chaperone FliS [Oscillospiraceae bacterium]
MVNNRNPAAHYQEQVINTATPGMITVMLFEEAAKNINIAIRAVNSRNIQESHNAILKAENIYLALIGFLNDQFEVSKHLLKMYDYLARRLLEANAKKDTEILKEVLEFTLEFRDTWKQAEKNANLQTGDKNAGIGRK